MLTELQTFSSSFQLTESATSQLPKAFSVIVSLLLAFVLGMIISLVYRWTHKRIASKSFMESLVLLSMLITVVMVVIGDSVARAFSLVGALSIIRFRTVVRNPRDIAFVFFVLAIGMGIGAGNPLISVVATFTICLIILGLNFTPTLFRKWGQTKNNQTSKREFILSFKELSSQETQSSYLDIFSQYLSNYHELEQRLTKSGKFERTFYVCLKREADWTDFTSELRSFEFISSITLQEE